jgi:ankyrin repeat protein
LAYLLVVFNKDGNTALMVAAENGHLEVVKYLVANATDNDQQNKVRSCALNDFL